MTSAKTFGKGSPSRHTESRGDTDFLQERGKFGDAVIYAEFLCSGAKEGIIQKAFRSHPIGAFGVAGHSDRQGRWAGGVC